MAGLVLDTGVLIALDRGVRPVERLLALAAWQERRVRTSAACLAQAWRDGARQARLARALEGIVVVALDTPRARRCGELLAASGTSDVADAALVLLAEPGDTIVTSDPADIGRLVRSSGVPRVRVAAL